MPDRSDFGGAVASTLGTFRGDLDPRAAAAEQANQARAAQMLALARLREQAAQSNRQASLANRQLAAQREIQGTPAERALAETQARLATQGGSLLDIEQARGDQSLRAQGGSLRDLQADQARSNLDLQRLVESGATGRAQIGADAQTRAAEIGARPQLEQAQLQRDRFGLERELRAGDIAQAGLRGDLLGGVRQQITGQDGVQFSPDQILALASGQDPFAQRSAEQAQVINALTTLAANSSDPEVQQRAGVALARAVGIQDEGLLGSLAQPSERALLQQAGAIIQSQPVQAALEELQNFVTTRLGETASDADRAEVEGLINRVRARAAALGLTPGSEAATLLDDQIRSIIRSSFGARDVPGPDFLVRGPVDALRGLFGASGAEDLASLVDGQRTGAGRRVTTRR